ncbi:MAG: phage protease [Verrucomicrobiia bacterium]
MAVEFAPTSPPAEIMVMPGGIHTAHVRRSDGKPVALTLQVDRNTAATLQQTLEAHRAAGPQKPWFDFDHDKQSAAGWPTQYLWRDTPAPGVYAKVEWSKPGAEAISGKAYRSFSPTFYVDDETANPARVIGAPLNMGGLVNDPALDKILPLWAKRADGDPSTVNMTPEELAKLQAQLKQLETENAELKAKAASSETAAAIEAKDAEITALNAKIVNLDTELKARRKAEAKAAVDTAVARGAIPPKDEALQAKWCGLIESDAANAELLAKMPGIRPDKPVTKPGNGDVALTREDIVHCLKGYLEAKTPRDKGLIYHKEINARLDKGELIPFRDYQDRLPLDAANTLGTLVGNIISQRTLALVYSRRPMLRGIITDFSPEGARLNQNVYTRTVGLPTVQAFPTGPATERGDTDYPVTLDTARQVQYTLTWDEYNATGRNLVAEHSEAMAIAIGNHLVDAIMALVTDDFTAETVLAAGLVEFSTLAAIAKAMNVAGVPDMQRTGFVNSDVAESLTNDELVMENFDNTNESAYGHWRNIKGFQDLWEYPALPANAINLIGFFANASALLLASRTILNPETIIGAGYPGRISIVTDPVTGLSVVSNQWVGQSDLAVNDRLIVMYGVDRGVIACGHKLVSA